LTGIAGHPIVVLQTVFHARLSDAQLDFRERRVLVK